MTDQVEYNPFSPEEAPGVQLIVQMRLYDVLLGILTVLDKGMAESIITAHAEGKILAPLPALNLGEDEDDKNS
jgi:hypothetical protein